MDILWGDHPDKPEDAMEASPTNLAGCKGDVLIISPDGFYRGPKRSPKNNAKWIESWPVKNFQTILPKVWSNTRLQTQVGILSGFDYDLNFRLATMGISQEIEIIEATANIAFINGPNLNLLGEFRPELYGTETLQSVYEGVKQISPNCQFVFRQTNSEADMIKLIHGLRQETDAIIINAGSFAHTSIAIADALRSFQDQVIELHITNPHQREPYRKTSYITPAADSYIAGFGTFGYRMALTAALMRL